MSQYVIEGEALFDERLACSDKLCLMLFTENLWRGDLVDESELRSDKEIAWALGLSIEEVEAAHERLNAAGWQTRWKQPDREESLSSLWRAIDNKGLDKEHILTHSIPKMHKGRTIEELKPSEIAQVAGVINTIKPKRKNS